MSNPHLEDALAQIREIRGQMARTGFYQGTRFESVAATGGIAILAAALQGRILGGAPPAPNGYIIYWVAAAALSMAVTGADLLNSLLKNRDRAARDMTKTALATMLPPVAAGAMATVVLVARDAHDLLPGLWMVFMSLTLFALRPLLPRAIGLVALAYGVAGAWILLQFRGTDAFDPRVMGIPFGIGQLAVSFVFYLNMKREPRSRSSGPA